jgi:hypothetical protein
MLLRFGNSSPNVPKAVSLKALGVTVPPTLLATADQVIK